MNDSAAQLRLAAAITLHRAGNLPEAEAIYRQILAANPNDADALQLLGAIAHQRERYGEAIELIERSLAIAPGGRQALNNLGETLRSMGQIERAGAAFREALRLYPNYAKAHSNLLLTMHYVPDMDPVALRREHEEWGKRHASAARPISHGRDRTAPDRPLRIGYVSPDFRRHSVAYFVEPILENHDREQFTIFCYATSPRADEVTERMRRHADGWHDISALDDDAAAGLIARDEIDVLVDLAGHMARNRLLVFARRPAAVQVTYLGYPSGTGMRQMDFRLSDAIADPPGISDEHSVEKIVRLPRCAWCYRPPEMAPAAEPVDVKRAVTFGSFNNYAKLSPVTINLWAELLAAVPGSRLLIKAKSLGDGPTREMAQRAFASAGVSADRLTLCGWRGGMEEHLATYAEVDIALDPFPYNGTTTICEAMWMGVPAVTLAGNKHVSRVGASLLSAVGLTELVAKDQPQYLAVAAALANDPARRSELRSTLRDRMRASPLMDATTFTRNLQAAYRAMWRPYSLSPARREG